MLIAEYLLREKTKTGTMPENPALVKTIVTTNMADVMTKAYNVKEIEVLTGFKYIGEQIKLFEQNHTYNYVFGLEESYGCLAGTHARDKDAVVAVMCLCEVAAYCKKNGITLWDQMLKIYEEYGYFKEGLHNTRNHFPDQSTVHLTSEDLYCSLIWKMIPGVVHVRPEQSLRSSSTWV